MITKRSRAVGTGTLRAVGLIVALVLALSACRAAGSGADPDSGEARELAGQLNENLTAAGLPPLDTDTATTLYGTDGGVSCENAGELQHQLSLAQFGNNSGNLRRVVLDPSIVAYDFAVIETYCPDQVSSLEDELNDLDTEKTIPTPSD